MTDLPTQPTDAPQAPIAPEAQASLTVEGLEPGDIVLPVYLFPDTHYSPRSSKTNRSGMIVACPFCKLPHRHGYADGWRSSHCTITEGGSYYLVASGTLPPKHLSTYLGSDYSANDRGFRKSERTIPIQIRRAYESALRECFRLERERKRDAGELDNGDDE